jgi:hypothetical protein
MLTKQINLESPYQRVSFLLFLIIEIFKNLKKIHMKYISYIYQMLCN